MRLTAVLPAIVSGTRTILEGWLLPLHMVLINRRVAVRPIEETDIRALSNDDLLKLVEWEWTRAKELDDKLQKLTAALSVSVTVGGLVANTILQDLAWPMAKVATGFLFLLAAALLLIGVLIGFSGLVPKARYGYGAAFMRKVADKDSAAATESLVAAAVGFQRDNTIRANQAIAATASIRNGIVVFVVAMLIGLLAALAGKPAPGPPKPPASPLILIRLAGTAART